MSFAYVRLDWQRSLCEACGVEEGIRVAACSCPQEDSWTAPSKVSA